MSNFYLVMAGTFIVVIISAVVLSNPQLRDAASGEQVKNSPKFKAKTFLSPNEMEFLARLESAVPELRFHAQVSMGAVLDAATPIKYDAHEHWRERGMFSQKIIDFVAQHRTNGTIVAIIELDDRTHSAEKDEKRDAMLLQAGYKVVRWNSKNKPDIEAIRAEIFGKLLENQ